MQKRKKKNPAESSFSVGLQPITPAAACASEQQHCSIQWENIPVKLLLPLPLWSRPFLSLLHLCQPFNVPLSTAMPLISNHLGATRCTFSWAGKCLHPLKKKKKKTHCVCDWLHSVTTLQKEILSLRFCCLACRRHSRWGINKICLHFRTHEHKDPPGF